MPNTRTTQLFELDVVVNSTPLHLTGELSGEASGRPHNLSALPPDSIAYAHVDAQIISLDVDGAFVMLAISTLASIASIAVSISAIHPKTVSTVENFYNLSTNHVLNYTP